jgi:nitrite reductase (NADH) large subunit
VGNTASAGALIQLFDRGDLMPVDPLEALCQMRTSGPPPDRVVCNCNKVTDSVLRTAIANGADSVVALGEVTRAGTGCGSCKGELAQLVSAQARKAASPSLVAAS